MHLYFIATQHLWKYAFVELVNSVLYANTHILKSSKIIFNKLILNDFSSCRCNNKFLPRWKNVPANFSTLNSDQKSLKTDQSLNFDQQWGHYLTVS